MVEEVETGGLVRFKYSKDTPRSELDGRQKREVRDAYGIADKRRHKEKKKKLMLIILAIIIIVGGLLGYFLR